jgi:hypothetical protein
MQPFQLIFYKLLGFGAVLSGKATFGPWAVYYWSQNHLGFQGR